MNKKLVIGGVVGLILVSSIFIQGEFLRGALDFSVSKSSSTQTPPLNLPTGKADISKLILCAPQLLSPSNHLNIANTDHVNFQWKSACLGQNYSFILERIFQNGYVSTKEFALTGTTLSTGFPYFNPWGAAYPQLPVAYKWQVKSCNASGCSSSQKWDLTFSHQINNDLAATKANYEQTSGKAVFSWPFGKYQPKTSYYYLVLSDLTKQQNYFKKVYIATYPNEPQKTEHITIDPNNPSRVQWKTDASTFGCGKWEFGVVACDQSGNNCSVSPKFQAFDLSPNLPNC